MNKEQLVKAIAEDSDLTQKDVYKVLASLEKTVIKTLESGEQVKIVGFMAVKPVARAQRKGRNPGKGQPVVIPEKVGVYIKPGENLKKAVGCLKYEDFKK